MCGRETLAMLVSSTSMNVASVTVIAMAHGLNRGRHSGAAETASICNPISPWAIAFAVAACSPCTVKLSASPTNS